MIEFVFGGLIMITLVGPVSDCSYVKPGIYFTYR